MFSSFRSDPGFPLLSLDPLFLVSGRNSLESLIAKDFLVGVRLPVFGAEEAVLENFGQILEKSDLENQ